jgi:hypothetical protein
MLKRLAFAATLALAATAYAQDFRSPAPDGAKVYFIEPKNGAEITGPVGIKWAYPEWVSRQQASRRRTRAITIS